MSEPRSGREFASVVRDEVARRSTWKRSDVTDWIADTFKGVKFGDPAFDWSRSAAVEMAGEFLAEASTW